MAFDDVWAGIAFEWGGEVGFGVQRQMGLMFSIGDYCKRRSIAITRYLTYDQMAISIGVGLGGGAAANFIIGTNSTDPMRFSDPGDDSSFDWSLDVAFVHLNKYFFSIPETIEMATLAKKNWKSIDSLAIALKKYDENALKIHTVAENMIKNGKNFFDSAEGKPTVFSFPIPGCSEGIRVSAKFKKEARVVTSWGTFG